MKLSTLLKGIETKSSFKDVEIERVTDKDKDVVNNTLFVCIDGGRTDGHTVAKNLVSKGAVAFLTERDLGIENQIIVNDTREVFSKIAANFYNNPARKLNIIGVTGTNGKTSTSYFIRDILNSLNKKCGLIGTVNNIVGTEILNSTLTTPEPMEIQELLYKMVQNGMEYCVMEVSSQAISQKRVYGIEFSVVILTNITPEHLDYHITMENYINTKLSILNMAKTAVLNIDDENIKNNMEKIKIPYKTISLFNGNADYIAKNVECTSDGVKFLMVGMESIDRISSKIIGNFTVYNILCAITALISIGFSFMELTNSIQYVNFVKGRGEKIENTKGINIYIDFAHTPSGLLNILNCLREFTVGRLIVVFGCGGDRDKSKRPIMGKIAGENSDFAIITTDNPRSENTLLIINDILGGMEHSTSKIAVVENRKDAIEYALKMAKKNDTVLIAGKGHEMTQFINGLEFPFDERKIIENYFKT